MVEGPAKLTKALLPFHAEVHIAIIKQLGITFRVVHNIAAAIPITVNLFMIHIATVNINKITGTKSRMTIPHNTIEKPNHTQIV